MFTWSFDAPSGVYKNHDMSSKVRMAAISKTKFMQFTKPEPGYGRKQGESITINRVSNLTEPTDGRLLEGTKVPEDELTLSTVAITVSEFGRQVPYSSLSDDLGVLDMENIVQRKLRDQMALVMDKNAAAAFKTAKVKAIPTANTTLVFDTDGTASTSALVNIQMYHVEQIRDYMASTLHVPPYIDDDYVCLISTKGARGIKNDADFEKWHIYVDPSNKFNSEIGRIEGVRFVEVTNTNALSGSLGTGSVLGEAVFFGEDPTAMAVALDPELRAGIPEDLGRKKTVGWYGILDFGIIWDTANDGEARIVHVTSS